MSSLGWILAFSVLAFAVIAVAYSYVAFIFYITKLNAILGLPSPIPDWLLKSHPVLTTGTQSESTALLYDEMFTRWRSYSNSFFWTVIIVFIAVLAAYLYSVKIKA